MNLLEDLERRGLLDSFSDEEKIKELLNSKRTVYCGFDPSAKSLQLGNFIMITILRRFQKAGHRVIALLGGATGMIGDPSGKSAERKFLSTENVKDNAECIRKQLAKYIDTSDPEKGLILDNYSWWKDIDVITFLREYGKRFQINYMLSKEVVKSRLETGISYAEFSYMILQSGDFLHLYRDYGCQIQFGGGDQWGNLTSALDFLKRSEENAEAEAFSFKLITDSNGKKFGKSEKGALYLNENMTSPYRIYQYFMNVSDEDILRYLYIFDDRDVEELNTIYKKHMEHPELREGQRELARSLVTSLHGKEKADRCEKMSKALFTDSFNDLSDEELKELTDGLTVINTDEPINILDALIKLNLASSKREAREFVNNKAVKINGEKIDNIDFIIDPKNFDRKTIFIKRGKKNYAALTF